MEIRTYIYTPYTWYDIAHLGRLRRENCRGSPCAMVYISYPIYGASSPGSTFIVVTGLGRGRP
jgi:hypothetical protein